MLYRLLISLLFILAISRAGLVVAEEEYWEYTFRPGDSIWNVAEKYTTTVDNWLEIRELNKIHEGPDRRIPPGTRIVIPVSMLKLQPVPAVVIAVRGTVTVERAKGDRMQARTGIELFSGDRVITADEQSLRMQFADRSELQVLPNSIVVLDKLSHHEQTGMVDTRVRLNNGRVNTWVEKLKPDSRYEIRTPAATTAVRGTAYRLTSEDSQISRAEVTTGLVGVAAGNTERDVKEGYGIVAEKDKPLPEPVKLLPSPEISDNLSADKSRLQVQWKPLDGAAFYRYQLATDKSFDQVIVDSSTKDNQIELKDLAPARYFLRVRGVDQYQLEGLDAIRDYEIVEPPAEEDRSWIVILSIGIMLLVM
ncbi:MAG: FecR domain-containing protein [Gammaproteobacteria bacterium]|jgi:hypothetical protein